MEIMNYSKVSIYGKEQIGYSPLSNQTIVKEYNVGNDYALL